MAQQTESGDTEPGVGRAERLGTADVLGLVGALAAVAQRSVGAAGADRMVSLGQECARITLGRSDVRPAARDWRFASRAWAEHPVYRRIAQSYLAWSDTLSGLVEDADLEWRADERARFAVSLLTSALAPTNQFLLNPDALVRAFETGGKSVLRSLRNMGLDMAHNHGMPRSVDRRAYEVGKDVAATPGAVVLANEVCELLQYVPTTESVRSRPVVVVPPQINKYYVMDLSPGRSFVEFAVGRGYQVFAVSWRNPTAAQRHWDLDVYVDALTEAIHAAVDITRSEGASAVGVCAGGLTVAGLLGRLAADGDEDLVRSATLAVTQIDYDVPSMIGMFADPKVVGHAVRASSRNGTVQPRTLSNLFAALRPNDLIWNYWVNNNLLGDAPPRFDILAWNADGTSLPAALHAQFLDVFLHNTMARGELSILGSPVDLSKVRCDTMVVGARTDHLVPWRACYASTGLLGGPTEFVLSSSGHIQSLVSPPGSAKMTVTTGPLPGAEPDRWLDGATEAPGVWWERWAEWQVVRAGRVRRAPSRLGSRAHPPIEPAPGRYVKNA